MDDKDPYAVLGVPPTADLKEIRTAYRKLAAKYHPDRADKDPRALERFHEATKAYELLSDQEAREYFDRGYRPVTLQDYLHSSETAALLEIMLPSPKIAPQRGADWCAVTDDDGSLAHAQNRLPDAELFPPEKDFPWVQIPNAGENGRNGAPAGSMWILFRETKNRKKRG